jgi:hypothetical protein
MYEKSSPSEMLKFLQEQPCVQSRSWLDAIHEVRPQEHERIILL